MCGLRQLQAQALDAKKWILGSQGMDPWDSWGFARKFPVAWSTQNPKIRSGSKVMLFLLLDHFSEFGTGTPPMGTALFGIPR